MKSAFVLLCLIAAATAALSPIYQPEFLAFKKEFNKSYATERDEMKAATTFFSNLILIEEMNADEEDEAEYGVTEFADLTEEEILETLLGGPRNVLDDVPTRSPSISMTGGSGARIINEDSWDWREHGVVRDAPDEGWCGADFAFAAAGVVEGSYAVASGEDLTPVSAMSALMCTPSSCGCFGGDVGQVLRYWEKNGVLSESDYPYTAYPVGQDMPCPADEEGCPAADMCDAHCKDVSAAPLFQIDEWGSLEADEELVAEQLVKLGPLSVSFNAARLTFYKRGVSKPKVCSRDLLNGSGTLVGFGTTSTKKTPYWIVQWSRGPKWGENGTFRIFRGDNRCGIVNKVNYATVSPFEG